MGRFDASLLIPGDSEPLSAILVVEDGRLRIRTASHDIGDWRLEDIALSSVPNGFRMEVEGEELIVELDDPAEFEDEVSANMKRRGRRYRAKGPKAKRRPDKPAKDLADRPAKRERRQTRSRSENRAESPAGQPSGGHEREQAKNFGLKLDQLLERADEAYGSLLPRWVFTRGTMAILGVAILVMILAPIPISTILLITGFLVVVFGAVVYTDSSLAARILPGRSTPTHVLITGVAMVVFGFLLGVIST